MTETEKYESGRPAKLWWSFMRAMILADVAQLHEVVYSCDREEMIGIDASGQRIRITRVAIEALQL